MNIRTVIKHWCRKPLLAFSFLAVPGFLSGQITLERLGSYETGIFDESAAEIAAYDSNTQRVFVSNSNDNSVDIISIADPANPTLVGSINFQGVAASGGPFGVNSVAVSNGVLAVALEANATGTNGVVAFYDAAITPGVGATPVLAEAAAGALPDMVAFSPDGSLVLVANEGEAEESGEAAVPSVNPDGTITAIEVSGTNAATFSVDSINQLDFSAFEPGGANELGATLEAIKTRTSATAEPKVRIHPNATSVSQDLEPEYITVSPDGTMAYVSLQENNAIAIIDLELLTIVDVAALGYKDHSIPRNGLDADKNDETPLIVPQPFFGLYMPDAMATIEVDGTPYILTTNEGDTRDPADFGALDIGGFGDEGDLSDATLDPEAFPNAATLTDGSGLGDLGILATEGDLDGDGDLDEIWIPGARSFTVWNGDSGDLVWDSGSEFERMTAYALPDNFNASNDDNTIDDRSDNKGPEPEAIAVGTIDGTTFAFIGLERTGGIMIYDITDPAVPVFVDYVNTRDFTVAPELQSDLGPESLTFIPATDSPNGENLVVMASEVSGSTTVYQVDPKTRQDEIGNLSTINPATTATLGQDTRTGFIVGGSDPAVVVIRGRGPSLAGSGPTITDPVLQLYTLEGELIAENDNWADADRLEGLIGSELDPNTAIAGGAMAETDAILIETLPPGGYTAVVLAKGEESARAISEVFIINVD